MKFQIDIKRTQELTLGLVHLGALLVVLILSNEVTIGNCEAKEFDWSDLGVSLANAKPSLGGNASNLRILVSPQRRKSYDFEYTNGSQPLSSSSSSSSDSSGNYVVASSSPYLAQSVYQLSPNHSGHSSAYSALSASLATLKNRLNARGVTLTSTLGGADSSSGAQPSGHALYTTSGNGGSAAAAAYLDSSQQAQQQAQQAQAQHQQQQQQQQQQQSQPTYLSVSSQQVDSQPSLGAYTVPPSQGNESNKTIVLAIPAKINFLTGGGSSSSKQQQHSQQQQQQHAQLQQPQLQSSQQAQQLSLLQTSGVIHGQDGTTLEQAPGVGPQLVASDGQEQHQQHHQYVIVNQQAQGTGGGNSDHHSVAASLSPTGVSAGQQVYSTAIAYQPIQHSGGYATIKQYIPATGGQPTLQKVYSIVEPQQQVIAAPVPAPQTTTYETQLVDQSTLSASRYTTCIDTCNSSDPRWRKYTVSKYKACCSRSSQFDPAFIEQQPSADKVAEQSARYSEDAYYNYLYRKTRARRARRHRANRYQPSSSRYSSAASSAAGGAEEEPLDSPSQVPATESGRSSSRGYSSSSHEYPANRPYYKSSRAYAAAAAAAAAAASSSSDSAQAGEPAVQAARGDEREPIAAPKYAQSKERSYRRARARDLDAGLDSMARDPSGGGDTVEDDSVYPRESASGGRSQGATAGSALPSSSSYGSGEYSVDLQGRTGGGGYGPASSAAGSDMRDEEEAARFDEPSSDLDPAKGAEDYYPGELAGGADLPSQDDSETEAATSSYNRYSSSGSGGGGYARKRKQSKPRRKQKPSVSSSSSYYKKSRKNGKSKVEGALNGTDYESAQPGDSSSSSYSYNQQAAGENSTGGGNQHNGQDQEDQTTYQPASKESSSSSSSSSGGYESSEAEKDAVLAKYRQSINETAVANLSKTTMHLKEILSILEKKAQTQQQSSPQSGSKYNDSSLLVTSTPAPVTTTTLYPPSFSSLFGPSSPYSSLSSDFLASAADFAPSSLKSPYRFDPTGSFPSGGPLSPSFSFGGPLSSSSFGSSAYSSESLGLPPPPPPPPAPYPQYATFAHASKHNGGLGGMGQPLAGGVGVHGVQKKRRPMSKSSRYNDLVLQKAAAHGLVGPSSLALQAAKNRLLNPAAVYYSALQYPYLYRGMNGSPSITNPYPYKSHHSHKNPYSSLLSGSVSSKLAAAASSSGNGGGGLYSDESRLHGLTSLADPLANMGSSLRPSAAMRLRNKPFIFQPQVLPIYTRHSILTSPMDAAAASAKAAA